VHLAAKGIGVKLVLISPPTSIAAVGQRRFPFLPVGLLLRHPFDNMEQAGSIEIPTLVIHGERDTIVDPTMGRAVAAAITGAEFHVAAGRGHNDLDLSRRGPLGAVISAHLDR
jgi:pimeloyl-ACP methyl ester carboxylesterase